MSSKRPRLDVIKKTNRDSLVAHKGFVYSTSQCLGKGSFGNVYLGWTRDGSREVAMKVIDRSFLKQDPKLRENLDREIAILKLMTDLKCDYVVNILDAGENRKNILIAMEVCDYDLDHLIKESPLLEEEVITFLHQLGEGMKALRRQNIVHRDLKPGNILIKEHPSSKKKTFKLADFGFARQFKDDANRNIYMQSICGTPVYMAPEALTCFFLDGKSSYDDKVDVWSIGALLYKVIVGDCGFYATLDKILEYLKRKGDAIAFTVLETRKISYIEELPPSVNKRLSVQFQQQMNRLLQHMLKYDPRERMSFPLFFNFVDDLITSRIEVVSLLHGTSLSIVSDVSVKGDTLVQRVHSQWNISYDSHIIFSPTCSHYITNSRKKLTNAEFDDLMQKSGGSYGHAKLYALEINQQQGLVPDVSCFEPLKFAIDNGQICQLIQEQQFCDEIVYMIESLRLQMRTQLEGLEKLAQFTVQEIGLSTEYSQLVESVHETLARVSLTADWLEAEMRIFGDVSGSPLLERLAEKKRELQQLVTELRTRPLPTLTSSFNLREYKETLSGYIDSAKRLPRLKKEAIPAKCSALYANCVRIIESSTRKTQQELLPFAEALGAMRKMHGRSKDVLDTSALLSDVNKQREQLLVAHASGTLPVEVGVASATPPSPRKSPQHSSSTEELVSEVARLRAELDRERASRLLAEKVALAGQRSNVLEAQTEEEDGGGTSEEERTIRIPRRVEPEATGADLNGEDLGELTQQLKLFCTEAQRISLPIPGANMYTDLVDTNSEEYGTHKLLSMAQLLADTLKANLPSLKEFVTPTRDAGLVRIANPSEYREGDVAAFVPFKTTRGFTLPCILHLQWNTPCMLMDVRSFTELKIKPGKIPELFFARLSETPRLMKLQSHKITAKDIGEERGDFYRVSAQPVDLKYSGKSPHFLRN